MVKEGELLKRQGGYIRHLRAKQELSIEEFADKLGVKPAELRDMENGKIEASEEVILQLLPMSDDDKDIMDRVFGDRFWETLEGN
ncbi:helix-turn-helix domain-containing protein [Chloroflexota bacterium]